MIRYSLILLWVFAVSACNEFEQAVKDARKEVPAPPRDNYIVLLDLSDRILNNNQQQVPKDIFVVESIYAAFKSKLNAKDPSRLFYTVGDKLKVLVAPQKNAASEIYDMAGDLRISLSSALPEQKAKLVESTAKKFDSLLPRIYKKAVISNNSTDYAGADIWRYFNEDLQDDLEKDAQNTLFIITDGYLNFESTEGRLSKNNRFTSCTQVISSLKKSPDWNTRFKEGDYGLLPVNKKFQNLRVVLLELNPKEDWAGEFTLLTAIWGKWFNEMGITSYSFVKDDNINEVNESLEKIMQVKLPVNKQAIHWKPVTDIDSVQMLAANIQLAEKTTADEADKKKELTSLTHSDSSHILSKTGRKKLINKPKEQVSFGPAY